MISRSKNGGKFSLQNLRSIFSFIKAFIFSPHFVSTWKTSRSLGNSIRPNNFPINHCGLQHKNLHFHGPLLRRLHIFWNFHPPTLLTHDTIAAYTQAWLLKWKLFFVIPAMFKLSVINFSIINVFFPPLLNYPAADSIKLSEEVKRSKKSYMRPKIMTAANTSSE